MFEFIRICGGDASYHTPTHLACSRIFMANGEAFILGKMEKEAGIASFTVKQKGREYVCTFMRLLDTSFKASLEDLISKINPGESLAIVNYSIGMFKVTNYQVYTSFISYHIQDAIYGEEILLKERNKNSLRVFSNCFKKNGKYFYFINNEDQQANELISEIVDQGQQKIYGFCVKLGNLNLCLPLKQLFFNTPTPFSIKQGIENSLKKVVYLSYDSSHCTGTLVSSQFILTVRHLFSFPPPKMGTIVKARFYPYNELKTTKVVLTSTKFIDLMLLEIVDEQDNTQQMVTLQQQLKECPKIEGIKLGQKVYAIGFGRYTYLDFHFQSTDLLLPTITYGVISKTFSHKQSTIFFKTDCSLYNGYSGCAIWQEGTWIGNTVFIIKNKVSLDKHAKHNFNYTREFIHSFLEDQQAVETSGEVQEFFRMFQAIHTRKELRIKAKL